ncbi:hypothetical protein GCM10027589_05970 [Actinocorallia lasiicapitis]
MSELVEAVELEVYPDYRMFGLGDRYAMEDGDDAPVPGAGLVGVGTHYFLVGTGGYMVHPVVRLEHWPGWCQRLHDAHDRNAHRSGDGGLR